MHRKTYNNPFYIRIYQWSQVKSIYVIEFIEFKRYFVLCSGGTLGVPVHVFGTETHMTAVVGMALGIREIPKQLVLDSNTAADMFFKSADKVLLSINVVCCVGRVEIQIEI